jgi:hypothetical protein
MAEPKAEDYEVTFLEDETGDCLPCEIVKDYLKDEIASGTIKVLDVNSTEAQEYLKDRPKIEVPAALAKDKKTGKITTCEIFADDEVVLIQCGGKLIPIHETHPL